MMYSIYLLLNASDSVFTVPKRSKLILGVVVWEEWPVKMKNFISDAAFRWTETPAVSQAWRVEAVTASHNKHNTTHDNRWV